MVLFRPFLLSPLVILFFSLVNSLHSPLSSVQVGTEWNDTVMEGSGEGEGSGQISMMSDEVSSTLTFEEMTLDTQSDIDSIRSRSVDRMAVIETRATDPNNHKLGSLPMDFLGKMDFRSPNSIPSAALMAMGRPLKKGPGRTQAEYIALLVQSSSRRWGSLFLDSSLTPQAYFIDNGRLLDVRVSSLPFRVLLLPPDASSSYNVDVQWVLARSVDPLSIVVQVDTRKSYPKITAGVLVYSDYEYLGEADVENRRFTYYDGGHVIVVQRDEFDKSVYVLTKTVCSCSCPSRRSSILANIKDFFG
ncbi:hypothetical protein PMAYCL1PPCAC_24041 [Pristionchus mayeri]|uniref:Uncharacterized protein n=1 Tax=Pristionchus mayeri TaxID=1317129 RepID=A0AAN5D001_9BILA|nr:hypothetical protein PMAYCL1PPCAC_24041 [Pristionchus mayeri]